MVIRNMKDPSGTPSNISLEPCTLLETVSCGVCGSRELEHLFDAGDYIYGNSGRWPYARCRGCGVVLMSPRILPSRIGAFYPQTYYTNESQGGLGDRPSFRNQLKQALLVSSFHYPRRPLPLLPRLAAWMLRPLWLKTPPIRRQIHWAPGGRVLDVGCGNGEMLDQYRAAGWTTVGVEPGPDSAALARAKGHLVVTGLLEDAGFEAASFEAITLWDALEHIPNPAQVMAEVFRLLKPGGRVYLHVPNYGSWYARHWQDRWFMFTAPLHYFHYTSATLTALLERAGLRVDQITTGLGEVGWHASARVAARPGSAWKAVLESAPALKLAKIIEALLPGGHLTAIATKPTRGGS
jgi:SAM-dependent methyltransferase